MKYYFQLQYKMLNRHLVDFGIAPVIAYVLLISVFVFGSLQVFERLSFALYLYPIIGLSNLFKLSTKKRNDFLKLSFTSINYKKIRILENSILITPQKDLEKHFMFIH